MKPGTGMLTEADYYALAAALATIPAPRLTKDPKEIGEIRIESAKHVAFDAILHNMSEANPEAHRRERDRILLGTTLVLLKAIGAVEVNHTTAAVTEPAGHLLHSLSYFLRECATKPICYDPVRLDPFEEDECKNPFLFLARQAEEHRIVWAENEGKKAEPIREQKIISVLIKGERANDREAVYLHVWKEKWNAYTLIGSEQIAGESPLDAAYRALKEDLEIPCDEEMMSKIKLHTSGLEDVSFVEYAPSRGACTRYRFNLLWVNEIDGELKVERKLKPRWLTYEEICAKRTKTGERILPSGAELLQAIDLNSVPVVIADARPFTGLMSEQVKDLFQEIKDIGRPLRQLMRSVGLTILIVKWWLLLLIGITLSAILLSPIIDSKLPGLSNVSDLLGIIGFIVSLIGLAIKLQRSHL